MVAYPMYGVCPINRLKGLDPVAVNSLLLNLKGKDRASRSIRKECRLFFKKHRVVRNVGNAFSAQGLS